MADSVLSRCGYSFHHLVLCFWFYFLSLIVIRYNNKRNKYNFLWIFLHINTFNRLLYSFGLSFSLCAAFIISVWHIDRSICDRFHSLLLIFFFAFCSPLYYRWYFYFRSGQIRYFWLIMVQFCVVSRSNSRNSPTIFMINLINNLLATEPLKMSQPLIN